MEDWKEAMKFEEAKGDGSTKLAGDIDLIVIGGDGSK